ncbi:MAG: hypothetical protein P0Y53_03635 [Candidatus Pseudobacter hemicellulosilyticus]|uniref:Outer membrane protein beta-barrel domain-containing protein n=1 Tax=Candidatus Pseudobacter hemicellulosilyticus TaxID=3121375 RepID=A0AAJ5WTZ9_9BACT|nr:MAG: hypothetical protein P0Y53_03635 [Pseudobacter sp.]
MNERLPYEKHLADKLQQLPAPEVERSWEQMRYLLDKELPPGGGSGGGGGGGRPGRRWLLPAVAGLILTGAWFTRDLFRSPHPDTQAVTVAPNNQQTSSPGAVPEAQPSPANISNGQSGSEPSESMATLLPTEDGAATAPHQPPKARGLSGNEPPATASSTHSSPNQTPHEAIVTPENSLNPASAAGTVNPPAGKQKNKPPASRKNRPGRSSQAAAPVYPSDRQQPQSRRSSGNGIASGDHTELAGNSRSSAFLSPDQPANEQPARELAASTILYPGADLVFQSPSQEYATLSTDGRGSLIPEEDPDKLLTKPAPRAGRGREGHRFAIGLSLPMVFPVADQKASGYNYWAGPNTASDYMPTPHVQYHFNHKTYMQTELQFLAPQYIRPVLLYQQKENMGNATMMHSVLARKLYYFNLPVSVHHSPLPNFYLGTGLQFSTLLNCIALYEDRKIQGPQDYLVREKYGALGKDSLSRRINQHEMRLLVDVNYYWQRFTVGLRYNQAFNNYANFRMSSFAPFTYDKNKAVLFYLRYNIWETKKRSNGSNQLSLK